GFTRIFGLLADKGMIRTGAKCPTQILVVLPDEARRAQAAQTAQTLRANGFNVELFHRDAKVKNQMAYAEKKGIPFVWFPPFKD
ncbi:His/Gly/Thr/Pro-type tRNA ligase C-terminal domain-containing protein, partial [Acinetobacter baumannii]|nr:His/Gly/Thr/Pro-type tRNA ligase C-terminal domain-containing protein [Acinetobacter baumannii]